MAALSQTWWELALFRFLTALGIGGEWAAGAALVAEVWPEDKRTKAAGLLQSAWAAGFLVAAILSLLLRNCGWRPIFVVGIAPALVALFVFPGSDCESMPLGWFLSRRSRPVRLAGEFDLLLRRHILGRDKGGPGLAGFRAILGSAAGNCRNPDQVMAVGTLNLTTRCLFVALQVLFAVRTGEFELVHRFSGGWLCFVATDLKRMSSSF